MNHRSQSENLGFRPKTNASNNILDTNIDFNEFTSSRTGNNNNRLDLPTELIQNATNLASDIENSNNNNNDSSGSSKKHSRKKIISVKNLKLFRKKEGQTETEVEIKEEVSIFKLSDEHEPRETWSKRLDFLMSIIGFSVDIAGIWRFPYLCLKNGGGAFLVPYSIMMCFLGLPLFYLELALGQYNKSGAITCWKKICPLLSGVGYAVVIIAFYTDFYYNVIISWGVYYIFSSFVKKLPWSHCGNSWNTKDCYEISNFLTQNRSRHVLDANNLLGNLSFILNETSYLNNNNASSSAVEQLKYMNTTASNSIEISSSEEFFFNKMYKFTKNTGLDNLGPVLWENVFCMFVIYIICYFSMWKGVKTSGKVVWFTALFPYVILFILLIQAFFLRGSMKGLEYYLKPDLRILTNAVVWMEAASQVCFSLGPGFGVLLAFSSYNNFHNNFYKDSLITVAVNFVSSFFSGAVVFMYLGYMSDVTNKTIKEVAKDGSSLIFIVYTEAISILPIPQFWSVIFFLMLLTLGLDSSFGGSEAIITALSDEYPILRKRREIFVAALFGFYLVVGIPSCTAGGYYIVEFLNNFAAVYSILIAVFFENIAVAWIYGTNRICSDIKEMIGIYPGRFWRYCWKFFTPCCLLFIIIMSIYDYQPMRIVRTADTYTFPRWVNAIGWCIALSSSLWIPVVAIYTILKARGSLLQRFKTSITPLRDQIKNKKQNATQTNAADVNQSEPLVDTTNNCESAHEEEKAFGLKKVPHRNCDF